MKEKDFNNDQVSQVEGFLKESYYFPFMIDFDGNGQLKIGSCNS